MSNPKFKKLNMKIKFLITALLLVSLKVNGQQLTFVSQYNVDNYITNPAAAGSYDYSPIAMSFRQQWVGFNEAPKTQMITGHMNIQKHHGVGIKIYNDVVGPLSRISIQGTYAYHVEIDRKQRLSFGLSFMANQHKLDATSFNLESTTDQTLNNAILKSTNIDADFGMYYYSEDYYAGISIPQLFQNKYTFGDNIDKLNKQIRHYYLSGGYKFEINREYKIEPSFLMKAAKNAPTQFELTTRLHYDDMLWGGITWRVKDAVSVMAGIVYENFVFGYAFDFNTTNIRNYSSGTHEIYIAYRISEQNKPSFAR